MVRVMVSVRVMVRVVVLARVMVRVVYKIPYRRARTWPSGCTIDRVMVRVKVKNQKNSKTKE